MPSDDQIGFVGKVAVSCQGAIRSAHIGSECVIPGTEASVMLEGASCPRLCLVWRMATLVVASRQSSRSWPEAGMMSMRTVRGAI